MAKMKQYNKSPIVDVVDVKKSHDEMRQIIKLIEAEDCVDVLFQVRHEEPQHQISKVITVEIISQGYLPDGRLGEGQAVRDQ
jgi:hypothetical protein